LDLDKVGRCAEARGRQAGKESGRQSSGRSIWQRLFDGAKHRKHDGVHHNGIDEGRSHATKKYQWVSRIVLE
jgi:hypothetical protein